HDRRERELPHPNRARGLERRELVQQGDGRTDRRPPAPRRPPPHAVRPPPAGPAFGGPPASGLSVAAPAGGGPTFAGFYWGTRGSDFKPRLGEATSTDGSAWTKVSVSA